MGVAKLCLGSVQLNRCSSACVPAPRGPPAAAPFAGVGERDGARQCSRRRRRRRRDGGGAAGVGLLMSSSRSLVKGWSNTGQIRVGRGPSKSSGQREGGGRSGCREARRD
jgi:hypothetical protein